MFTQEPIPRGAVVEVAPCIDRKIEGIEEYMYESPIPGCQRLVFGYAMLYAHSANPNLDYTHGATEVVFTARRDINVGEELSMDYGHGFEMTIDA